MPRKWTGKWFKKNSGVKPTRHGRGRGKSRGLRTQVPVAQMFQPPVTRQQPTSDQPRRTRSRKRRTDGQK